MSKDKDFVRDIEALAAKITTLEQTSITSSHEGRFDSPAQLMMRINAVQTLVDQIEIEIDKLEMRVSAIEHVGFRLRTNGQ